MSEAATARTADRGLTRSSCTPNLFFIPWTTIGLPAIIARYPWRATMAGDAAPIRKRRDRSFPATVENSVAVAPGQLTVAVTPVPRSSYESASVNEFTNALLA